MCKIKLKYDSLFYSCMVVFMMTGSILSVLNFTNKASHADNSFILSALMYLLYIVMGLVVGVALGYGCSLVGGIMGIVISMMVFGLISVHFKKKLHNKELTSDLSYQWGESGFLLGGVAGIVITPIFFNSDLSALIAGPFIGGALGGFTATSAAKILAQKV